MLTKVTRPDGLEVTFTYDALGRRVTKKSADSETRWIWDGDVILHELHSDRPADTWYHEPESFTPLAKTTAGSTYHVVADQVGAPTALYDHSGRLAWQTRFDPFGQSMPGLAPLTECPFSYPGQQTDTDCGLAYNRFRYYEPDLARYISQDPLGLAGGYALYGYVDDPLTWIDPLGLMEVFRGGTADSVHFVVRPNEYKIDKQSGLVKPAGDPYARGLSVFDNPESIKAKGFVPYRVVPSSIPSTLAIEQRGRDPRHFEILPRAPVTPEQYQQELHKLRAELLPEAGCSR
jgi:RHS repeat-associated protein